MRCCSSATVRPVVISGLTSNPDKIHYRVRNNSGRVVSELVPIGKESLTPAQFSGLSDVPPELEWLANITNAKTRHAYKSDVAEFILFTGLQEHAGLRTWSR